jgi:glutathione S-transferase
VERVRLTGIPGSHPVAAVQAMLEYKHLPYVRRDLPNMLHRSLLRALGFRGRTVPVARVDGRRVEGSLAIARALEQAQPEPPLYPADPQRRARVEELERRLDRELQETARRLGRWAAKHDPSCLATFATPSHLPMPQWLVRATLPVLGPVVLRMFDVADEDARALLAQLPAQLDHVDAAIADGVIGGAERNAADFQAAASVRLLLCFDDLRPRLEARPAAALARRLCPEFPGRFAPVFPRAWLPE